MTLMASKYFVPVALVFALFVSDALFAFVEAKGGGGGGGGGGRGGGGSLGGGGGSRGSGCGGGSMPILSNHGNRSSSPSRFYDHRDRVLAFGCVVLVAFVLFFWDFIDYSMPCNHGGDSNIWEIKAVEKIWAPRDEKRFFAARSEDKLFEN